MNAHNNISLFLSFKKINDYFIHSFHSNVFNNCRSEIVGVNSCGSNFLKMDV